MSAPRPPVKRPALAAAPTRTYNGPEQHPGPVMDTAPPDFTAARNIMVDGQVRPNKVNDPRIIQAMRALPRERFAPPALASVAYSDAEVPLGRGRFMLAPMVIARLVQSARIRPGERALVAACGTGYGAALAAACGAHVTALDDDPALLAVAGPLLAEFAPGVTLLSGPLGDGVAHAPPWDVIILEGAVRAIPPGLAAQVAPGGRLLTIIAPPGGTPYAVLAEPSFRPGELRAQPHFDAAAPLLPAFLPAPAFTF